MCQIDLLPPANMQRNRNPYHVDVFSSMQGDIQASIQGLTQEFAGQNNRGSRTSVHDKISNLYKRRKLAVDSGCKDAIAR